MHDFFRYPKLLIHKKDALPNVSKLRGEIFSAENSETRSLLYDMFRYQDAKQFRGKTVIPTTSFIVFFLYLIQNKTQNVSSTNCFGIVGQKAFDGKPWYFLPDPLWSMKASNKVNFQKRRMISLRNVSVLWDQKYSTENRGTHPLLSLNVLDASKFLKNRNVCLRKVSGLWNRTL